MTKRITLVGLGIAVLSAIYALHAKLYTPYSFAKQFKEVSSMFHKNIRKIHLLYGGVICILLVPLVIFLISSWNSIPQEPIKIYKTPVLKKQTPEKVEETPTPEEPSRDESETWDSEEPVSYTHLTLPTILRV